ncbi:hypothetical protein A2154_04815 [Candidatus Gottesmanbacteria bacterium RBG_16_43_7]|uniref:histidine kinase n=1 Tax=Candidatus Gottesmanbacteria bacterium RBG_16_43_7 TaxID=1798373 RepID=A0A1F5Z8G0_9BACT|nr:MAG: hypothetical protein A2154_04815 [Candidatus Gottesmanbacteria bacterium RBG_16_43_7]
MKIPTLFTMNTKGVRFRLTALYSGTLIFSLAILFVSFYWVTQRELYNHTDTILQSHAARIITILSQDQFQLDTQMSSQLLTDVFNETPGMLVLVTNNQGDVLSISQRITDTEKIALTLFNKKKDSNGQVFVNQAVGSMDMRFLLYPVNTNGVVRDIVMVGHPIDVIQKSLRALYGSLTLVFLSFVIPTIVGGYMLAGSALRPVVEISREMEEISLENLKRRVKKPETNDEIENLVHTFNSMLDRLEESFTRERQFIGDIAHELKTPLSTLKTGIEVTLSRQRTNIEYKKVLTELLIDANRLSGTLTNILDLAWSRADSYENLKDTANISEVIRELAEIAQKLAYGKGVSVKSQVESGLVVRGKKDKLFRAILNIIDNAVKYSKSKGNVSIKLIKKTNQAVIRVMDTGIGIAKADLPYIFDRFYRGSKTDKTLGSGLGLSIAKAVITSCGGTIGIKSVVGKGTSVTITFPLESMSS